MEVGVKVWHEERLSAERHHVASAYLTFVSLSPDDCQPSPVPPLLLESDEDRRRNAQALARRAERSRSRSTPKE
jgi:acyl-CoA hydrolase